MVPRRNCLMLFLGLTFLSSAAVSATPPVAAADPLPAGATARLPPVYPAQAEPLFAVAFAPDGKTLAAAGADGVVRIWDPVARKERRRFAGHEGAVRAVAFTPDGARLISAGEDGSIRVWVVATGRLRHLLRGHTAAVLAVACAREGTTLASAGRDNVVYLWNLETGRAVRQLIGHRDSVYSLAFSPDSRLLASGGRDRTIHLWRVEDGKLLRRFKTSGWVFGVAFSGDGKLLAAGGQDQTLRFWRTGTGAQLDSLGGYEGPVLALALSADGSMAAAGNEDRYVRLWNTHTGKERRRLEGHRGPVRSVALSPDGKRLASVGDDGLVLVWDLFCRDMQWLDLGSTDAAEAEQTAATLAATPGPAVTFLQERLHAVRALTLRVDGLVADLDGPYAVRLRATRELERLGELAESTLRETLRGSLALETQRRIGLLLARLPSPVEEARHSDRLRVTRAVALLERIGTPAARQVLQGLAHGPAKARLTAEAKAALERLAKAAAPGPGGRR